jgi:antitoxin component of MazEF toxin-antitoxin module
MQAKYPVKVQAIRSEGRTDRFYVFIPLPLAAAIGLEAGEEFQWSLSDRNTLAVRRVTTTSLSTAIKGAIKKKKTRK